MKIPRILIAGTNSGCGKTTIATGIMAALVKKGLKVQAFKTGPDYIDPMFHTFITGRNSRNLDAYMLSEDTLKHLFVKNSINSDISIIEGVMGLYDGFGGYSQEASTAHVSGIIDAPVILVVNGEGMSLSIAALIKGYMDFNPAVKIQGVIINKIKNQSHFLLLKEIIEQNVGIKALGYLLPMEEYNLKSRHLGLVPAVEMENLKKSMDILSEQISKTIDLDLLLKIAKDTGEITNKPIEINSPYLSPNNQDISKNKARKPRIAVAMDKAFNFYYKDNLDILESLGAEIEYFSPMNDKSLPNAIDGLYIGGGYPEVFTAELEGNYSMRQSIRSKLIEGLPAYAECGGLMYLSQSIENDNGQKFVMVGALSGESKMTNKLQRFGYVEVEAIEDSILADKGQKIRGHEFHYSVTDMEIDTEDKIKTCWKVVKRRKENKETSWNCGYKINNLIAGYPHLHFWGNIDFAVKFIESCKK